MNWRAKCVTGRGRTLTCAAARCRSRTRAAACRTPGALPLRRGPCRGRRACILGRSVAHGRASLCVCICACVCACARVHVHVRAEAPKMHPRNFHHETPFVMEIPGVHFRGACRCFGRANSWISRCPQSV
eukprot:15480240-Alexandrium_andersonii.AAC.1